MGVDFIFPENADFSVYKLVIIPSLYVASNAVLATYDHPYFSEYPAVTLNEYGEGTLLYQGSIFSDQIQTKIIEGAAERAGITHPDQQFNWPLIAKSGVNEDGNTLHFYHNYSSEPINFVYPHTKGQELVSEQQMKNGQSLTLAPWDILIIEEN